MLRGKGLGSSPLVAVASVVALFVGGCTVVFPEEGPARIILAPRPVRTFVVVPAVTGQQFEAAEMILAENGTRFDPSVVEIFLDVRSEIETIQAEYVAA